MKKLVTVIIAVAAIAGIGITTAPAASAATSMERAYLTALHSDIQHSYNLSSDPALLRGGRAACSAMRSVGVQPVYDVLRDSGWSKHDAAVIVIASASFLCPTSTINARVTRWIGTPAAYV